MQKRIRQIVTVVFALVLTFGILVAGQWVLRREMVAQPLKRLLASDHDLSSYRLTQRDGIWLVHVSFRPGDLRRQYRRLDRKLAYLAGAGGYRLKVDEPGGAMQSLWEEFGVAAQDGIATGRFLAMQGAMQRLAAQAGGRLALSVDDEAVYISFRKGDNLLEEVVLRPTGGTN